MLFLVFQVFQDFAELPILICRSVRRRLQTAPAEPLAQAISLFCSWWILGAEAVQIRWRSFPLWIEAVA